LFRVVDGGCPFISSATFLIFRDEHSPEAVNISNMAALINADGKPHFKYIVEGAKLFFTQQACLHLEKRKVILFKNSSANKGSSIVI
jgi:NAD-specific glutamate dehydrogenase